MRVDALRFTSRLVAEREADNRMRSHQKRLRCIERGSSSTRLASEPHRATDALARHAAATRRVAEAREQRISTENRMLEERRRALGCAASRERERERQLCSNRARAEGAAARERKAARAALAEENERLRQRLGRVRPSFSRP